MSVREEDRQRNCPGRGLGIAAAAIGVGVGAALYYFFNKRSENRENPDAEGSTSNWNCEDNALQDSFNDTRSTAMSISNESCSEDSLETSTSFSSESSSRSEESSMSTESDSDEDTEMMSTSSDMHTENSYETISEHSTTDTSINITINNEVVDLNISNLSNGSIEYIGRYDVEEHSPINVSNVAISLLGNFFGSSDRVLRSMVNLPGTNVRRSPQKTNEEIQRLANIREQAFRERSWAVEECSICFEPMQRSHEVLALPCTHRFHQPCILPWLQERQTCPNCRKEA